MARLIGPDEAVRTVFLTTGSNKGKASAQGMAVPLFVDAALSIPADVRSTTGDVIAGTPPTLIVDVYSRIPLIQYPDGVDIVYTSIGGGPPVALYARTDDRIDALQTAVGNAATSASLATLTATVTGKADRALSNLTNTGTARASLRIGAEQSTTAIGVTITANGADPRPVDYFGGYLYGAAGTALSRSSDDGVTWSAVATTPYEVQRIFATSDGEVIFTSDSRLYKSSGWTANPATATWNLKLTANASAAFFRFGIDGNGTKFIANQYSAVNRADSRYVHISIDSGTTWNLVWDTTVQFPVNNAESHLHGCCYDPWEDRFWFAEGHGTTGVAGVDNPRGVYYSSNNGTSWTRLSGGYADSLAALPTVYLATDDGIVCGTDDHPNGIMGIRRTVSASLSLEIAWRRWEPKAGAYGLCERGFRDPVTGLVYLGFRAEYTATGAYIAAGTASSGGLVWDSGVAANGDKVQSLVVTASGRLLALYWSANGVTANILRANAGLAGSPDFNTGSVLGGTIAGGTGMAAGLRASATGTAATAVGPLATANATQATAVGYLANSVGNGVAVGFNAQSTGVDKTAALGATAVASGSNATAVGYGASSTGANGTSLGSTSAANSSNSTALGKSAAAGGNATAVGSSATASGADQSSAFGATAIASGARTTAIGYAASAVGSDATVLGVSASAPSTSGTALGKSATSAANGTAVGLSAAASGADQSTALGATSTASGVRSTAVGYGATAGGTDTTVVGNLASAPSTNATAIGKSASATGSGMAVGKSATASGTDLTTAIGTSATASVTRATALGHSANAGHDNAIALGYASTSTDTNQLQIGSKHIEGTERGTDPAAPAADAWRLYARDNGSGKTQLVVRFATGAVQVIATEP